MAGIKGKQGRRPKPTVLKLLAGTYRADEAKANEPKPRAYGKAPPCPAHLEGEARREWRRMATKLARVGLLTEVDTNALALYCTVWARWRDAEDKLKEFGAVLKGKDGWFVLSPYLRVANECIGQMGRLMSEFGITPASRARVEGMAQEKKRGSQDPKEAFFTLPSKN